jgi:hypothetical protein
MSDIQYIKRKYGDSSAGSPLPGPDMGGSRVKIKLKLHKPFA